MNGTFRERVTPLITSAMKSACFSLSITQGPAIRNKSPEPMRTPSTWNERLIERFQGFKVSRFQGFKVSRFQGFKVSRFQGFKVSRFSRFQGFKVSRFQTRSLRNFKTLKPSKPVALIFPRPSPAGETFPVPPFLSRHAACVHARGQRQ